MRPVLPIIFLLQLFTLNAFGQTDSLTENKIGIELLPFSLLDPYNGSSLRLGTEIKLIDKYSLYTEIGTFLPRSFINSYWFRNNNGLLLRTELKRYFNKKKTTSGIYSSIDLFYKYQSYKTTDSINLRTFYKKDYTVYKNVYCFTLKFGELTVYKNGLLVDLSVGIGARFKFSKSSLTSEENRNLLGEGDNSTNLIQNKAGKFIYPNFALGIKLGFSAK
jgi:hypothetical protein